MRLPTTFLILAMTSCMHVVAHATEPLAGIWELKITSEGAPTGSGTRTVQACLTTDRLSVSPEQAFFDATKREGDRVPKCAFSGIERDASGRSAWKSQCETPFGTSNGSGKAELAANAAKLEHQLQAKTPMGALRLIQTIEGRRIGACS